MSKSRYAVPDDYEMPFGIHIGLPIGEVPASYLDWLSGQDWLPKWPTVKRYIQENRELIERELENDELENDELENDELENDEL